MPALTVQCHRRNVHCMMWDSMVPNYPWESSNEQFNLQLHRPPNFQWFSSELCQLLKYHNSEEMKGMCPTRDGVRIWYTRLPPVSSPSHTWPALAWPTRCPHPPKSLSQPSQIHPCCQHSGNGRYSTSQCHLCTVQVLELCTVSNSPQVVCQIFTIVDTIWLSLSEQYLLLSYVF